MTIIAQPFEKVKFVKEIRESFSTWMPHYTFNGRVKLNKTKLQLISKGETELPLVQVPCSVNKPLESL